jgi:hypothetical protein
LIWNGISKELPHVIKRHMKAIISLGFALNNDRQSINKLSIIHNQNPKLDRRYTTDYQF